MTILLTGSSGWLGQHLVPLLKDDGYNVVGVDPTPSPWTDVIGSVANREFLHNVFHAHRLTGVIHAGALHKPDITRFSQQSFVDVNVSGTLNILELASSQKLPVVFTSTTSLMISQSISDGAHSGAIWLNEDYSPLKPRNIYGVTKLCAENLCRQFHIEQGLNVVVLRTSRFFPGGNAPNSELSETNIKINELLNRRATVEDMARAHICALKAAPRVGFGLFIVSAPTPFLQYEALSLRNDAANIVKKRVPTADAVYQSYSWTLPNSIARVYDGSRISKELGFSYKVTFASAMQNMALGHPPPVTHDAAYRSPSVGKP